jgi:hypothetical protein
MRTALISLLMLLAAAAQATGPSWPIFTDVKFPAQVGPDGGRATVVVTVSDDATDIRLQVYGDDSMHVDPDNNLVVQLNALHPGQSFAFEVGFQPGPGRSYLAVAAYARFTHSAGGAVHEYPFGSESPEQLREHSKCVRQDPDGTWIRIMGCDEDSPAGTPSGAPAATERHAAQSPTPPPPAGAVAVQAPPIAIDIAALRTAPPLGRHARLEGYVVDSYRCPPCPHGAMCKPCVMSTAIFVADVPEHARFSWTDPPADVAVIAVDDPAPYEHGVRYRFEVAVPERARDGAVDATLVRSQRADEPIWAEPMRPEPGPAGSEQPGTPR